MSEENKPEGIVAEGKLVPLSPPKKIDLHNAHAIRRELAAVYRDMRAEKIEPQDGTRLGYMLNLLRQAYETSVLQDKLEAIETTLKVRQ